MKSITVTVVLGQCSPQGELRLVGTSIRSIFTQSDVLVGDGYYQTLQQLLKEMQGFARLGLFVLVRPNYNDLIKDNKIIGYREWRSFNGEPLKEVQFVAFPQGIGIMDVYMKKVLHNVLLNRLMVLENTVILLRKQMSRLDALTHDELQDGLEKLYSLTSEMNSVKEDIELLTQNKLLFGFESETIHGKRQKMKAFKFLLVSSKTHKFYFNAVKKDLSKKEKRAALDLAMSDMIKLADPFHKNNQGCIALGCFPTRGSFILPVLQVKAETVVNDGRSFTHQHGQEKESTFQVKFQLLHGRRSEMWILHVNSAGTDDTYVIEVEDDKFDETVEEIVFQKGDNLIMSQNKPNNSGTLNQRKAMKSRIIGHNPVEWHNSED